MVKISKFEEWLYWNLSAFEVPLMVILFSVVETFIYRVFIIGQASAGVILIFTSMATALVTVVVVSRFLYSVNKQIDDKKRFNNKQLLDHEKEEDEKTESVQRTARYEAETAHIDAMQKLKLRLLQVEIKDLAAKKRCRVVFQKRR